jgi:hypothetical protein
MPCFLDWLYIFDDDNKLMERKSMVLIRRIGIFLASLLRDRVECALILKRRKNMYVTSEMSSSYGTVISHYNSDQNHGSNA